MGFALFMMALGAAGGFGVASAWCALDVLLGSTTFSSAYVLPLMTLGMVSLPPVAFVLLIIDEYRSRR